MVKISVGQKKALAQVTSLVRRHKLTRVAVDDAFVAAYTRKEEGHWEIRVEDDEWSACDDDSDPHYDPVTGTDLLLSCEQLGEDEGHRFVSGPADACKSCKKGAE